MEEQFVQLFEEALPLIKDFTKENYEKRFHSQYEAYQSLLKETSDVIASASCKEETLDHYASIIPDYALETLKGAKSNRIRSQILTDYNYAMVTYVIPLIDYYDDDCCKQLADRILELWNERVAKSPIQRSTYDSIYKGFSQRLCYITTAVCGNLGKQDDCYELETLRHYRDHYLASTEEGKQLIDDYYACAPHIVEEIDRDPKALFIYESIYNEVIVPCVQFIEEEKLEECKALYINMVQKLQERYLHS